MKNEEKELGFGKKSGGINARFINRDGSINVLRKGLPFFRPYDFYHNLITMGWLKFCAYISISFLAINILFSLIYVFAGVDGITGMKSVSFERDFVEAFFFSIQTITTVGFGYFSPESMGVKVVSSIESFVGLLGVALATGVIYGRFSRPAAKILYSKNAIIAPFKEKNAFMFKMANQRSSKLIESEVSLVYAGNDSKTGVRSFKALELELKKINFFSLTWTIVHPIENDSPLLNMGFEEFKKADAEFIILVKAFDDTFSQTVYSRMSYKWDEMVVGAKFKSSIHLSDDGLKNSIDLAKINDYEKVELN